MSNIQYAFIERGRVPDRSALQASIDALGFDLALHPGYAPFDDAGFLPFVLNGASGPGFDIRYEDASATIGEDRTLRAAAAGRDHCISMAWHGSMKDLACVMIVSCALTRDFGAVVSYEGDPPESLENLLAAAHEALEAAVGEQDRVPGDASRQRDVGRKKPWWKLW